MLQIVRQTWQERYDMYMQLPKEQLAIMLAEQSKWLFPNSCTECVPEKSIDVQYYTTNSYNL